MDDDVRLVMPFVDLQTENARLRAALAFYADPKHWEAVEVEKITDVLSSWVSGPAVDGGARARAALTDGPEEATE